MAPGRAAGSRASSDFRIVIELVVPDDIKSCAVVDLIEGRADRIGGGVTGTSATRLQRRRLAAGKDVLLAGQLVILHRAAELAAWLGARGASGERGGVELEDQPPGNGMSLGQQGRGAAARRSATAAGRRRASTRGSAAAG